jgi:hypothetical protein
MNNSHVEEEVGKLKEEIRRLGQQQPDGSYKVRPFFPKTSADLASPPRSTQFVRWPELRARSPASRRADAQSGVRVPIDPLMCDSPAIAHFAGFCGDPSRFR